MGARFKDARVDVIQAYGFLGCPFCHRAVEAGNALAAEIKDESVFTFHGEEMVWARVAGGAVISHFGG